MRAGKSGAAVRRPAQSRQKAEAAGPAFEAALASLQERLGYTFADPGLLTLALTHSSFIYEARLGRARANGDEPNQPGSDNEQLEFLGDAVLGLAVTELLLTEFPERTEGELTRMRSAIVSRKRMAELGEQLALGEMIRLGRSAEIIAGRQMLAVLANTAEAVLGAVYLDVQRGPDARARTGERALRAVRNLVERLLVLPELPGIRAALESTPGRGALRDAKSRLQERAQAVAAGRITYVDAGEEGPAHARRFTVAVQLERIDGSVASLALGEGGSKKEAQQAAAELALQHWTTMPEPARERTPSRAARAPEAANRA